MSKIYRSDDDLILLGVFGGLGEYLKINSDILRVAFIILSIFTNSFFLAIVLYGLAALLMSKKTEDYNFKYNNYQNNYETFSSRQSFYNLKQKLYNLKSKNISERKIGKVIGYTLIVLGTIYILRKFLFIYISNSSFLALFLIALGFFIIFKFDRNGGKKNEKF